MPEFFRRDFFTCQEFSKEEIDFIIEVAKELKRKRKIGYEYEVLKNKTLFMLFYATSTRTRNSFEAAMTQLGGHAHFLAPGALRMGDPGAPEAIKDTVKVLERYGECLAIRVYYPKAGGKSMDEGEDVIREYAKWAEMPVVSMESDMYHPMQALADMMCVQEKFPRYEGKKYVQAWGFSPDALRVQAVPQSNVMMMARYGMDVVYARPKEYTLYPEVIEAAKKNAEEYSGSFTETDDLKSALEGADVVYMRNHMTLKAPQHYPDGEKEITAKYSKGWTLTDELMDKTNKNSIVMHCLPVDRDHSIMSSVLDGPHSVIFDEAENRLHVQKAVLSLVMSPNIY